MFTVQKIKKLIIIFIFVIIFTLSLVFHSQLNPLIVNSFANEFNIISNKNNLLVHFIDVGQADAVAINLPDGKTMLIDTGSEEYNVTYTKYLKENVLHTKTNNYIDYLVLSHADMDHVGGTLRLIKNFKVGTIFLPSVESTSTGYQEILSYVENNCNYQMLGDEFVIVGNKYTFTFFENLNNTNTNDSSQVVKLESDNNSFLFVGDISSSVEDEYISQYGNELDCDVLKVAHHGSKTATTTEFLKTVSPKYAVISVGANNDYGHPTEEVLTRLNDIGAEILRTDKNGDVLFVVGECYNLKLINKVYYITGLSLDYAYLVVVIDVCLFCCAIVVIIKKEKKKNKHRSKELLV